MNNSKITSVLVAGSWASGKTSFHDYLVPELERRGCTVTVDSDRWRFEEAVLADIAQTCKPENGVTVGSSSILFADGPRGQRKFKATDGALFNEAHDAMIAAIPLEHNPGHLHVVEFAIGPNVRQLDDGTIMRTPLFQEGAYLTDLLNRRGVHQHTLVVEIWASRERRWYRNQTRDARVPEAAFLSFAGDYTPIFALEQHGLPHYEYIDNDHNDLEKFRRQSEAVLYTVLSRLNGEGVPRHLEYER